MRVTCRSEPSGVMKVRASGQVTRRDLERLRSKVATALDDPGEMLLDFRGLERWDLPLMQLLVAARRSAAERGLRVEVLCDESAIARTKLVGLGGVSGV